MAGFSIRNPFFIIVCCLIVAIVGAVTLVRMPVDLFPPINIPVVVVATFYSGMPPQQIETNISSVFSPWPAESTTSNRARCPESASSRSIFSRERTPTPI
jgi:Cu/Ag efflux pump CusA